MANRDLLASKGYGPESTQRRVWLRAVPELRIAPVRASSRRRTMLVASSLNAALSQVTDPSIRAAILMTPSSRLVAYASSPPNAEDLMRVLVPLNADVWREACEEVAKVATREEADGVSVDPEDEIAMFECEVRSLYAFLAPIFESN